MKDSEFIELLNLYLDHEISATDAARLESEVQQNPARRRLYTQYCRVQKACTVLAKDYVDQAAASGAMADRKIAAFEPRRSWGIGVYSGGLALAAACVALVLFNRSPDVQPATGSAHTLAVSSSAPAVGNQAKPSAITDRTIPRTVTVPTSRGELQPALMVASVPPGTNEINVGPEAALVVAEQQALQAQFDWIRNLQLSPVRPVPSDEPRFDTKGNPRANLPTFGPGRVQPDVQSAAYQFQR